MPLFKVLVHPFLDVIWLMFEKNKFGCEKWQRRTVWTIRDIRSLVVLAEQTVGQLLFINAPRKTEESLKLKTNITQRASTDVQGACSDMLEIHCVGADSINWNGNWCTLVAFCVTFISIRICPHAEKWQGGALKYNMINELSSKVPHPHFFTAGTLIKSDTRVLLISAPRWLKCPVPCPKPCVNMPQLTRN